MGTVFAIFVRIPDASSANAFDALLEVVASERQLELRQHPKHPWIDVRHYGDLLPRMPEARLAAEISCRMKTEVILTTIQTTASVLGLARFESGVDGAPSRCPMHRGGPLAELLRRGKPICSRRWARPKMN
jgi:hypothetical protein